MKFISFRRYYLDKILAQVNFYGRVLDVGGKKINKRGTFVPSLNKVYSWEYLNIDASTKPDYFCSAENIPVENNHFDIILMTEVIEHLQNPESVLKECFRVLKNNGSFIITMPLLYPIHADPYDFQRWTPDKIRQELRKIGFKVERILPIGGIVAVILDLVNIYFDPVRPNFFSKLLRILLIFFSPIFIPFDAKAKLKEKITTGFYIESKKLL